MFEINAAVYFDGAHFLRDYQGKCANIHGHTWRVEVTVTGKQLNEQGLLLDFNIVKKIMKDVTDPFDHKLINDIEPFNKLNPSSENLAKHFFYEIKKKLATFAEINVQKVLVSESRDTSAVYFE